MDETKAIESDKSAELTVETQLGPVPVIPEGATVVGLKAWNPKDDEDTGVKTLAPSKTLGNTNVSQAIDNVRDIKFAGDRDAFKLLSKAWSSAEGWMKSTKAMNVPHGVIVQVSTQQGDNVAEALIMVPGARVVATEDGYCLQETPT